MMLAVDRDETSDLLRRARAGSEDAVDALWTRAAGKLLPFIRLRMGPSLRARLESRDILQASLLKAHGRLDRLRADEARGFLAWLARIAENEIRDRAEHEGRQRRDAGRTVAVEEAGELPSPVRSALSLAIWNDRAERVERALEALPEASRELIVLRKIEELSFPEIGGRLDKSADACRVGFARAMAALTRHLAEEKTT